MTEELLHLSEGADWASIFCIWELCKLAGPVCLQNPACDCEDECMELEKPICVYSYCLWAVLHGGQMAVCTDMLSCRELTWVFECQLWNLSRAVHSCWWESYPNRANKKLGNAVCHISNSQNFSQSLRFLIYFQKLSTEAVLYVKLTLVPGKTGISAILKGNPSLCVCVYVCSANSLEQT